VLLQRHRHAHLVLEEVAGRPILVLPDVFNPKLFRTGELLVEILDEHLIPQGSTVLDMGTGSGVGAVFAARWARRVLAVDVNPAAVRCARINALLNRVEERVEVRQGDLFAPVQDQQFDVVLFNPPFLPGVPRTELERALRSTDIAVRFAADLAGHLAPGGYALVILSSDGDQSAFLEAFRACHLTIDVVAARELTIETLTVYRVGSSARGKA
jgi:HemK-related putative methylase